jgi:alkylation response protein AidB-like acyl-CoA dehydrogenase
MAAATRMGQDARLALIAAMAPVIRRRAGELDERAAFGVETFAELRAAGMLALTAPLEYGGAGLWWDGGYRDFYELLEALAFADSPTGQLLQVHSHALGILSRLGSEEQRARFLPAIVAEGQLLASVGSEAKPTGKLADIDRTELEERADGLHLTCRKYFASLAPAADELLIWTAVPGPGPYHERAVIVMVPRRAPEVELIDEWDVMGMRATVSWSVRIDDYAVPPERLIGAPGDWVRRDPRTLTLAFAANHIGSARAALQFATDWVRERPDLAGSEIVRVALGTLASELFAARAALEGAAATWDRSEYDRAELESIETLHLAKRIALTATQQAFDICGARATFRAHALERIYRDVRTFSLHFRDEQYMLEVGRALLEDDFHGKGYAGASTFPTGRA